MPRLINALEQLFSSDSISQGPSLLINYDSLTGSFVIGETVTGSISGATLVVKSNIISQLTGSQVEAEFQVGETITGGTSGATATVQNFFLYDFPSGAAPLANGQIDFFESGSSTLRRTTYSDVSETIPNPNPLILRGDGRVPPVFGSGNYRIVVRTATGIQLLTADPIGGDQALSFGSDWAATATYELADVVRDNNLYWISLVSNNLGNRPSSDGGTNWQLIPFSSIALNTSSRQALIEASGQTFAAADSTQENRAVSIYASVGTFFTGGGAVDAYTASVPAPRIAPTLINGTQIRSVAVATNTGASTLDALGSGVLPILMPNGDPLLEAVIKQGQEFTVTYFTTHFTLDLPASVGGGATGGGTDEIFYENGQNVTTDYTLTAGKNALSAGPITINDGVTVTIPPGSTWTIV